jgi:outer membrane protein
MKFFLFWIIFLFNFNSAFAESNLFFFLESAYKNNHKLNAERENFKAIKQNLNISKSEFLPSISITGSIDGNQSSNRTDQVGANLSDISNDTETKKISIDQKIFSGFENYNSYKKSELEIKKAKFELKNVEQLTLLNAANVYFDLIYKSKSKKFNLSNVDLFERQVESDSVRMQKGEITLTDLAQSESSLAGAKAKYIAAETELLTTKSNFERIIRIKAPNKIIENFNIEINLPNSLAESLSLSEKNNPKLLIARLNYQISEKNLNIQKAKLSPTASINFSKSESKDYSSTVDKIDQESVKAIVSWPIIKGGKNYASIKKSQYKKKQSNLILKDTINDIKTQTANAWSVYQSAESVQKSTISQVEAAEIANEGITLEYDSGNTRTTLEVIQSRSLLLNARIANAIAERDFIVSKFSLLETIGKLNLNNIRNL